MKTVALISGGKDSCFNMMHCVVNGHDIVALANLHPPTHASDELDSYMFQTVGHHVISLYAECLDVPLFKRPITGASVELDADYVKNHNDEVEDLYELLLKVKTDIPDVEGVSVGAILSNYQRVRVENVCSRLGLTSIAYLWRRDQSALLKEMIDCQIDARIIKVASIDLESRHLGQSLQQLFPHLTHLHSKYGSNVCGEGGEYETLTLDSPMFKKRIVWDETEIVHVSKGDFAPVSYLRIKRAHTVAKESFGLTEDIKMRLLDNKVIRLNDCDDSLTLEPQTSSVNYSFPLTCAATTQDRVQFRHQTSDSSPFIHLSTPPIQLSTGMTIETETKHIMDTLQMALKPLTLSLSDVIMCSVYVQDMADFSRVNSVYGKYFGLNPPARVCVQVDLQKSWGAAAGRMQVDVVAARNGKQMKRSMHVQGVSYWAPANIGPYSQSQTIGACTFIAGQVGLQPHSMTLPSPPILSNSTDSDSDTKISTLNLELRQSLLNLRAIYTALKVLKRDTGLCICYVTEANYIDAARKSWKRYLEEFSEDEDEFCSFESEVLVPTTFVVVPHLPRNACVEWQVLVFNREYQKQAEFEIDSSDEEDFDDDNDNDNYGDGKMKKKRVAPKYTSERVHIEANGFHVEVYSKTTASIKTLVLECSYSETSTPFTQAKLSHLQHNLTPILACHLQGTTTISLRIFHAESIPGPIILQGFIGVCESVVAVPVKCMAGNGVLSLCVHAMVVGQYI